MSLTRTEWKALFSYAASSWAYTRSKTIRRNMVKIMDLCESVIGQQSPRPDREHVLEERPKS